MPPLTHPQSLGKLFQKFGTVRDVYTIKNTAFIHMDSEESAMKAISELNGVFFKGSNLLMKLGNIGERGPGGKSFSGAGNFSKNVDMNLGEEDLKISTRGRLCINDLSKHSYFGNSGLKINEHDFQPSGFNGRTNAMGGEINFMNSKYF